MRLVRMLLLLRVVSQAFRIWLSLTLLCKGIVFEHACFPCGTDFRSSNAEGPSLCILLMRVLTTPEGLQDSGQPSGIQIVNIQETPRKCLGNRKQAVITVGNAMSASMAPLWRACALLFFLAVINAQVTQNNRKSQALLV